MVLIQIDTSEQAEKKINHYKEKWSLNKLATVKKMLENFEDNGKAAP